jgi:hypothetical protein
MFSITSLRRISVVWNPHRQTQRFVVRRSGFFTLLLAVLLASIGESACATQLYGHWTFANGSGSTATDVSGMGNNGTLCGTGATWATGVDGGGAINLSKGTSTWVILPSWR